MLIQAGYMLYAATTSKYSFDLQLEEDVYLWITGRIDDMLNRSGNEVKGEGDCTVYNTGGLGPRLG